MAEFENGCEETGVPLLVLPPRRPQWNGCVERANRSARTEFWGLYDGPLTVADVAPHLAKYEFFFNYERPHASLAYRTPNECSLRNDYQFPPRRHAFDALTPAKLFSPGNHLR